MADNPGNPRQAPDSSSGVGERETLNRRATGARKLEPVDHKDDVVEEAKDLLKKKDN